MKPRILIVEDEEAIASGLKFNFDQEGYDTVLIGDGPTTLKYFAEHPRLVQLVVLDLMLPGMSGYEICRAIRQLDPQVPILVLSARTLSEDRAHAFDCGCDQFMTKPFALPELLSRVRNLLDRQQRFALSHKEPEVTALKAGQEEFCFNNVSIDFRTFQLRHGNEIYPLTTMELQLLRYFVEHEGTVLSRTQILRDVWEQSVDITTRTIDNFVLRLRKYIEPDPASPIHLLSVRGTGYRFVADPLPGESVRE